MESIVNYVLTLPGCNKEKKGKQVSQVLERTARLYYHSISASVYFARRYVWSHHANKFGRSRFLRCVADVLLNRRILCVLLSALDWKNLKMNY